MMEKVKAEWQLDQNNPSQLLEDGRTVDMLLKDFEGEAKVIRYPQVTQDAHFLGVFIQHHASQHPIQLLVKASISVFEIIDATIQCELPIDDAYLLIDLHLNEPKSTLSSEFWTAFYTLPSSESEQRILKKLNSWSTYIDYLMEQAHYPYSVASIEKAQEVLTITLYETPLTSKQQKGQEVWKRIGDQFEKIARCDEMNVEENRLFLQDATVVFGDSIDTVYLYKEKEYNELLILRGRLRAIHDAHMHCPQIHHPLLNPYHTQTNFSGLTMMKDDIEQGIQHMVNQLVDSHEQLTLSIHQYDLAQKLSEKYVHLLPIHADGRADEAIQYVKTPLIEKNTVEITTVSNALSEREEKIQQKALIHYNEKLQQNMQYVSRVEQTQQYLKEEEEKNLQKITQMQEAITQYEQEQERLAFKNDQLMQERFELEDAWHEQQQRVKDLQREKEEKIQYYQDLEQEWLIFNQEIPSYTDNIEAVKKIESSQIIIRDCELKIERIQTDQHTGKKYVEDMITEHQLFLTNQQVEHVQALIQKVKKTAEFLDIPMDLQFASSYAELTQIYLEKFNGIEAVEERLNDQFPYVEDELKKVGISFVIPDETNAHYDRHYAEDQLTQLLGLLDNKPLSLGINYKAKNRWKEHVVESVRKLTYALAGMKQEKEKLEQKLMIQLDYAERIEFRFDQDVRMLQTKIDDFINRLEQAKKEYEGVIETANQDISAMRKTVKLSKQTTSGRSQQYDTLEDLENARKQYKTELLSKYDVLEEHERMVEEAETYVLSLASQYEEKTAVVIKNKEEMNIQMDLLQHDIVNSKAVIEQFNQANHVIHMQQEELQQQLKIFKAHHQVLFKEAQKIQVDIERKAMNKTRHLEQQHAMQVWRNQLTLEEYEGRWYQLITQKSRLRFTAELHSKQSSDLFLFEDVQYTWLDMLLLCQQHRHIAFVTTDLSERSLIDLEMFEQNLRLQGFSYIERQEIYEHLQMNPLKDYVAIYEQVEKPYVIDCEQDQLSV